MVGHIWTRGFIFSCSKSMTIVSILTVFVGCIHANQFGNFGNGTTKVPGHINPHSPPRGPWENMRLPSTIIPSQYTLVLKTSLEEGTFEGTVMIEVTVTEPTLFPRVHATSLEILSASITKIGTPNTNVPFLHTFFYEENEFFVMNVGRELDVGNYNFEFEFKGSLNGTFFGYYRTSYRNPEDDDRAGDRLLTGMLTEPSGSRLVFPCFDEPSFKAHFTVRIIHEPGYIALSNMDVNSTFLRESSDGQTETVTTFNKSVKMSIYLLCFIVCDYSYTEGFTTRGLRVRVYAPDFQIERAAFALQLAINITDFYEQHFEMMYSLPKLDLIVLPDHLGWAMETWGIITFREGYLLQDDKDSSARDTQQYVAYSIAHELAHMWFGNIITTDWWNNLWIQEGAATYFVYVSIQHALPSWEMASQFPLLEMYPMMDLDQFITTRPLIPPVETMDDLFLLFDYVPYRKGASVLRLVNSVMGENAFMNGLRAFLEEYQFDNVNDAALFRTLQDAYDQEIGGPVDITELAANWTKQIGYPVININRVDRQLRLEQEWFLISPVANRSADQFGSDYGYTWKVPLSYSLKTSDSKENSNIWIDAEATSIDWTPEPDDWYLANIGRKGYYRVNYDQKNWERLTHILKTNHEAIPITDRAGIIDDAFNLARAGKLPYSTVLDISTYLANEKDYVPWSTAIRNLNWLSGMLRDRPCFSMFESYIVSLAKPLFLTFGFSNQTDDHLQKLLNEEILYLICGHGYLECLNQAKDEFEQKFLNDQFIPPDVRGPVYHFATNQRSSIAEWNFMWKKYRTSTSTSEQNRLLYAMAKTRRPWLLSRYIEWAKDSSKIRVHAFFDVLWCIADNPVGNPLVWDFIRTEWNWIDINIGLSSPMTGNIIAIVSQFYSSESKLNELETFFAKYPEAGAGEDGRNLALEYVRANIVWMRQNEADIENWLVETTG